MFFENTTMNPSTTSYAMASLYVGDLYPDVTEDMLRDIFSPAAPIHSIRVYRDRITRRSLGYGYINFQHHADAERAVDNMNFHVIKGRPLRMMWSQQDSSLRQSGVGNIFIKNLEKSIDSVNPYDTFSVSTGNVLSCNVVCDENGSKGYGFVHFETSEAAERAIKRLNGMLFNDRKVFIGPFKPCKEREAELKHKSEMKEDRTTTHQQGVNLCVKNLDHSVDDERLLQEFAPFGSITNAKVVMEGGRSKGCAFVQFSSLEEATRAAREMNGRIVATKPVYVALIHRKEERQAHLTNQHRQRMATVRAIDNPVLNPHQPAPPSRYSMTAIPQLQRPSQSTKWQNKKLILANESRFDQ